jgi:hypothetical protein
MCIVKSVKAILVIIAAVVSVACSGNNDSANTTATTIVPPPPRQILRAESRPGPRLAAKPDDPTLRVDPEKPLLIFNLPNGKTFREGEEVVVDFSLANAALKGDGGEYRVRYFVVYDDARLIERWEQIVLSG